MVVARPDPNELRDELWRPRLDRTARRLHAVIDGARGDAAYAQIMAAETEKACLYRGELHPEIAKTAPYLVALTPELPLTIWLLERWGGSWGIFVDSDADLAELRRHFRRFLMVYTPKSSPVYFRYYDPRVLREYLPIRTAAQHRTLFAAVHEYMLEDASGEKVLRFRDELPRD